MQKPWGRQELAESQRSPRNSLEASMEEMGRMMSVRGHMTREHKGLYG